MKVRGKDSEVRSELGALTSDWPPAALAALSHRDGAAAPTRKGPALLRGRRQVGCCPALTKGELCRGGEEQWDGLRGGELNPHHKHLIVKACFVKNLYGEETEGIFLCVGIGE